MGKFISAFSYYSKFHKRVPKNPEGHVRKAKVLIAQGKLKQAEREIQKGLFIRSQCPRLNFLMATCHYLAESYRKAIPSLNRAIYNDRECS